MSLTGVLFTCAFLAACVLAFTRRPIFGALAYIATIFFSPQLRWWGQGILANVRWSYIAAIVTALALIVAPKAHPPRIPAYKHGVVWALGLFVLWLAIQYLWAFAPAEHLDLISYYVKFIVALVLIYRCLDSESSLRLMLWVQVIGIFYLAWLAYTTYSGGRFEEFGGAGLGDANAAALAIVTGIFAGSSLFLASSIRARIVLVLLMPFIVNALVTTISRSGFLALAVGAVTFNWFTPRELGKLVRVLSALAVILFLMLTGPSYWTRMHSIEQAGEQINGVNTGEDRIAIIKAQWRMFERYPLGCGAMCTAVLSPQYLEDRYLAVGEANGRRERASHNTFMTMLVEHGIPGAIFYLWLLWWAARTVLKLRRNLYNTNSLMSAALPGVAAIMAAIAVGDLFVSETKFEIRFWFLAVLMSMLALCAQEQRKHEQRQKADQPSRVGVQVPL